MVDDVSIDCECGQRGAVRGRVKRMSKHVCKQNE